MYSIAELNEELRRLSTEMDEAHKDLVKRNYDHALAQNEYRKRKAELFIQSTGTVDLRKAIVDEACEAERLDAYIKEGMKEAAIERVRNCRVQMSALQTLCHSVRIEIEQ